MSEQGCTESKLHNHGREIHIEYGGHHYVMANVSQHREGDKQRAESLAEQIVLSWNEHNTLRRQRDELLNVMENIAINLGDLKRYPTREQLKVTIDTSVKILNGVIAQCKENQ